MRESRFYQLEREIILREATINHISMVLKARFPVDIVNALTPIIQKIGDVQRLEQLLIAASEAQNIESFEQMLHE